MRRFKPLLMTALALMVVCMFSAAARASIIGSKHDFGGDDYKNWSQGQICLPCHIPHNATVKDASGNYLDGPLWNHTLSTATYTLYTPLDAPTTDANGNPVLTGEVDENSMLCLSCHDGTVALDSFGGGLGTAGPIAGTPGAKGSANLGTDLSDDHPIGERAVWPDVTPSYMVDPSLRDAQHIMPLRHMADGKLAVGCTSCHEPHNRAGQAHMLWVNNSGPGTTVDGRAVDGSLLCLNCHKK